MDIGDKPRKSGTTGTFWACEIGLEHGGEILVLFKRCLYDRA